MTDLDYLANIQCDIFDPKDVPITLGNSIICDGFIKDKTTAVFSHFHSDHIKNFNRTLTNCDHIILTEATFNAIEAIKNEQFNRGNFEKLPYGRKFHTDKGETIELINANHVPGSCQVYVEMEEDGAKILYSGDFCYPGIQVPKCDVLVLEAEHGTPTFDYDTDKPSILRTIFDEVYDTLVLQGKPVEIRAHRGTMQDIMAQLESGNDGNIIPEEVPFLSDEPHIRLTKALENQYSKPIREIQSADDGLLNELYDKKQPYVRFAQVGQSTPQEQRAGIIIQADVNMGFKDHGPFFTTNNHRYFACLSSHSSYKNILEYVKKASPKLVLVDGTRTDKQIAMNLANKISQDFHIRSVVKSCP